MRPVQLILQLSTKLGYNLITSTRPETMFKIDRLIDTLSNSFCIFVKRNRTDIASENFTREYRKENFYSHDHRETNFPTLVSIFP